MDPRAFEHLKGFYDFMVDDVEATKMMNYITGDDYTTKEVQENVVKFRSFYNCPGNIFVLSFRYLTEPGTISFYYDIY